VAIGSKVINPDHSFNRIALVQATRFAVPLEWFDGAVLFWEEIGGQASHVWSYLQVMRHCGIFDRISGIVVGVPREIAGLDSPEASPTLSEIVLDVLGDRDIPVLGNVEFGHAGPNLPMPVGIRVGLDTQQRTLSLLHEWITASRRNCVSADSGAGYSVDRGCGSPDTRSGERAAGVVAVRGIGCWEDHGYLGTVHPARARGRSRRLCRHRSAWDVLRPSDRAALGA
jgi:hypothetical protein